MNSSPFLPAAPSTLNVGADDPVRPKAPVCKGPRAGTGVNDMPRLRMPAGICRRRRLRIVGRAMPTPTNLIALPASERRGDHWSPAFFEPILFFLCQKEKNGFNLPRKEREQLPTVVLNLTQKISAISCPSRPSLPPERSLRCSRLSEMPSMRFQLCTHPPPQRIAYPLRGRCLRSRRMKVGKQ